MGFGGHYEGLFESYAASLFLMTSTRICYCFRGAMRRGDAIELRYKLLFGREFCISKPGIAVMISV